MANPFDPNAVSRNLAAVDHVLVRMKAWDVVARYNDLDSVDRVLQANKGQIAALFVERPWRRCACPLGAATGLVSKLSPFYLKREAEACKACAICTKACPVGLPVHTATTIKSADCIGCLECVDECPREGALELKLGVPLFGK